MNLRLRIALTCLAWLAAVTLSSFLVAVTASASSEEGADSPECHLLPGQNVVTSQLLTVLTLNLAHGRKDAFNQMLQKTNTTRRNLEEIAGFFRNSGADLVALQEADAPSFWSGKFSHVDFLAEKNSYPCRIHASQAHSRLYDFGTALLSRVPFTDRLSHTFAPSPPTTTKGFVMGKVLWNPGGRLRQPVTVSVISVHLDFSRKNVREAQVEEMRSLLADIATTVIILGDFNTDWSTDESALRAIVEQENLEVFRPGATDLGTYRNGKHRLDWILISKDLEFVSYEVPQLILSDHQPVTASIRLSGNTPQELNSGDPE